MEGALTPRARFLKSLSRSATGLLQDGAELHRKAHIAGHAQLALHESAGAIELAADHFLERIEPYADRAVCTLVGAVRHGVRRRLAVDVYAARLAEIELQGAPETGIGTDRAAHLFDDLVDLLRAHDFRPSQIALAPTSGTPPRSWSLRTSRI